MSATDTSETIYQGRVKWFNNKAGYGFITVIDGQDAADKIGTDVFTHHSAICVSDEQYKYLVQGEYVEFALSSIESTADYKYQASNIKGLKGGKLLCETRNETRSSMPPRQQTQTRGSNDRQRTRPRGSGPRDGVTGASAGAGYANQDTSHDAGEWVLNTPKRNIRSQTNEM
jgi:cold shock CspA family protein